MLFPDGGCLVGKWENGVLKDKQYFFKDKLPYKEEDKIYCTDADRRFEIELRDGISPFD